MEGCSKLVERGRERKSQWIAISEHRGGIDEKVIRGEETRRHGEASFKAEEGGCHICGIPGHFWKKCRHYNSKFSLEQNRDYYVRKKKRGQDEETTDAPAQRAPRGGDDSWGRWRREGDVVTVILRYRLKWPISMLNRLPSISKDLPYM